ncbi:MAG: carboxylate-amine ligase [Acidobacteria bacterium]|nr:carboxylate-amine ligase [Acidobacteriota bacterium]
MANVESVSVIPKPPFASDVTLERELREFENLKPRLKEVWHAISLRDNEPHTSVVVPSLTLDQSELKKLVGASFYEERLLFLLIRLRNPRARVVFVTSQPVHPLILEYYFQLLVGIPGSHARSRLTLLCAYDASPKSLTEKILERPRLIERIRMGIQDPSRAYLTVFNSTPHERKLAVLLGIPLNGVDPELQYLGTKSGSRKAFREAGVSLPLGMEDLRSPEEVEDCLLDMKKQKPGLRKAVVKLNDSFSGEGNAIFRYPESNSPVAIHDAMRKLEFAVDWETYEDFFDKYSRMGGIVEEFLEGENKMSPSCQLRVDPHGETVPISTHDQVLGGASGQVFLGCLFPAADEYRLAIQEAGLKIGKVMAKKGVISRFAIDFLVVEDPKTKLSEIHALEINLRMGGTTHPFLALQFITGGQLDPKTALFVSPRGRPKFYRATDNLKSEKYKGLLPEDLIDILTHNGLHYTHNSESGVLFHLIGALSQYGKLGMTAIGNSREEVETIYNRTLQILDRETQYGR